MFRLRVLVVTGILAESVVRRYVAQSSVEAEVTVLPRQVAALMSAEYISDMLASRGLSKFNFILVPGMTIGDTSTIHSRVGAPAFKGPRHAADIPVTLEVLGKTQLSTSKPSCELLREQIQKQALAELSAIYGEYENKAKPEASVQVGSGGRTVWVGGGFPPRVLAEIIDASRLSDMEIQRWARYYVDSGADIVDVGMVAGGGYSEDAERAVRVAREAVDKPVSIDTNDVEEIRAAVRAGVDLILSVNAETMEEVSKFAWDTPVVVTPATEKREIPSDPAGKVKQLESNLEKARGLGFRRLVADPVVTPILMPNMVDSLVAYYEFARRNPDVPVLLGAGNVTELMDGDSVGANLLLAGVGVELGVGIVLTTEASDKTRGCVRELSEAVRMVTLAKKRNAPPKDLGLDLLVLKEKRRREEPYGLEALGEAETLPSRERTFIHDPEGCFRFVLDRDRGEVVALHYRYGSDKPSLAVRGKDPLEICSTIIERGLISRLDHAAYLGVELEKAGLALRLGRSYVQDAGLFE